MPAYALTVEVDDPEADDLAALLLEEGATGAEIRDSSVTLMPAVARPGLGRAEVVAFFASRSAAEEARAALGLSGQIQEFADEDWGENWKRGLSSILIGRIFIRPSWIRAAPPPGTTEVVLDPGMAFGTGTHPTTALCLAALDACLLEWPGADVLDVGTGTGLLAIAARKLGAKRVVGTDVDPVALRVAAENAQRNGVALELSHAPPRDLRGPFQVVLVNILANTLVALAPEIVPLVGRGGVVLLAGILEGQQAEVEEAYRGLGLEKDERRGLRSAEWRLLAMRAREERPRPTGKAETP
ncbi:MAG TPA: 50S ribosomal protein L11 methyltransferase [Anaeromyxobacteraceae bacterium]|nr:50S ribosomal protein L11 methyltransferase [Anaeromyxobacteraceae bacterium]